MKDHPKSVASRGAWGAAVLLLAVHAVAHAPIASAQAIPGPGERPPVGAQSVGREPRDPEPGNVQPAPGENPNRPSIDFTITVGGVLADTHQPVEVYPGDRVTIRWHVRPQRLTDRWTDPVRITAQQRQLPVGLRESAGAAGSYTFTAHALPSRDEFTLVTGPALYAARRAIGYRVVEAPVVLRVSVLDDRTHDFRDRSHAFADDTVALDGSGFGAMQGDGRVSLRQGGDVLTMPVTAWSDMRIVARVPGDAKVRRGQIVVGKGGSRLRIEGAGLAVEGLRDEIAGVGEVEDTPPPRVDYDIGRLLSTPIAFDVWGQTVVTSDDLRGVADGLLDLDETRLRLHHGERASTLTFSDLLHEVGVEDRAFTIPSRQVTFELAGIPQTFRFKVNDMNSLTDDDRNPEVAIVNGQLVLGLLFESADDEIIGEHVGLAPDIFVPNVQLNHARVNLRFTPGLPAGGTFQFESADARLDADVQVGADWLNDVKDLSSVEADIKSMLVSEIGDLANRSSVRSAIGDAFMEFLRTFRAVSEVKAVFASGDEFVVHYQ